MPHFNKLLEISRALLSNNGCDWDKKQTIDSLVKYLHEETLELRQAIEKKDYNNIKEEIGDVLYILIFLSNLAAKDNRFSIEDVLKEISEKLIRRHPHVFSDVKVNSIAQIEENWQKIKLKEKSLKKNKL
jgi:nucleoside triphosphate diphosphatase